MPDRCLQTLAPIEREIEAQNGAWYSRRVLPYRTQDNGVEGVVITFADITGRRHAADALAAAMRQAELANAAKSRFLAAASHDLRQPLQTLALLQGLLAKTVEGERARKLVARLDETLGAMTGHAERAARHQPDRGRHCPPRDGQLSRSTICSAGSGTSSPITRMRKGLGFRMVPCSLPVQSDPRLLEQMIRNLLSNALKYTSHGKVLLGCRRHRGMLSIEVWDTGVGIPDEELQAVFEEYHQLDNAARERSRGLGLGLSIVQRLGKLLGHRVRVRSRLGKGSVFAIEIVRQPGETAPELEQNRQGVDNASTDAVRRTGVILVVEDDPEVRELLELVLGEEGHRAATAPDGVAALDLVTRGPIRPDLIIADYNLPNGLTGLQFIGKVREKLHREIPVIILTGDISTVTLREIALQNCVQLNKPVKLGELTQVIQRLLPVSQAGCSAV